MPETATGISIFDASLLIVDDEASNVRLLEKLLEMSGYRHIHSTQEPGAVMGLIATHQPEVVLLDLNMPKIDGYEVLEQIMALEQQHAPLVLVLTAQHAQEYRIRALEGGARDYVTKPFDRTELLARVRNLVEAKLAQRFLRQQNEMLEQKVVERTREIHETRLQVVRRLGLAAEYRDNETGLHIIRMSKMSAVMAKVAGMDDYQCDLLLNAAPMHDIGKIGIPDYILLKPGKFEPDEWEIMKTHAEIGAKILSGDDSDLLRMASEIAITHHEKWDGSGYPNGLVGEEIPLVGRLVALADVFDALTSKRPYKEAWPVDRAVETIKGDSGSHFDPQCVEYFLTSLDKFIEIKEKHAEPEAA